VVQAIRGEARAAERCGEAGGIDPDWGKVGTASRGSASPRKQTSSVRTDAHGESAEHTPHSRSGAPACYYVRVPGIPWSFLCRARASPDMDTTAAT
jgi:hypothetical protein